MTMHFEDNQQDLAAQAEAEFRAAAAVVFADVSRFGEPSTTLKVWEPTTSGQHPSLV